MPRKAYTHSTYWRAKKKPRPHSYVEEFLGYCAEKSGGSSSCPLNPYSGADVSLGLGVGIIFLSVLIFADIANTLKYEIERIADPVQREILKRELMIELRKLRRAEYYKQETERRRALAAERRKIKRRTTLAPEPMPEDVLEAWNHRKDSKEAMIRLGGMLQDLECYVNNCLRIDDDGMVRGRRGGIKLWLELNLPELFPKYKTLMRYKAMAIKLRQATGTKDPVPTETLLKKPYHAVVNEILQEADKTFAVVLYVIDRHLSPDRIFDG